MQALACRLSAQKWATRLLVRFVVHISLISNCTMATPRGLCKHGRSRVSRSSAAHRCNTHVHQHPPRCKTRRVHSHASADGGTQAPPDASAAQGVAEQDKLINSLMQCKDSKQACSFDLLQVYVRQAVWWIPDHLGVMSTHANSTVAAQSVQLALHGRHCVVSFCHLNIAV
jgi:hypothetical protein